MRVPFLNTVRLALPPAFVSAVDDLAAGELVGAVGPDGVAARPAVHLVGVPVVRVDPVVAGETEDHVAPKRRPFDHVRARSPLHLARPRKWSLDANRQVARTRRARPGPS